MRSNNRVIEKANKQAMKNDKRREVINRKDIRRKKIIIEPRGMGKEDAGKEIKTKIWR